LVDNLLNTIANGHCHEALEGMVAVVPMAQVAGFDPQLRGWFSPAK